MRSSPRCPRKARAHFSTTDDAIFSPRAMMRSFEIAGTFGRVASATTIAVGDEGTHGSRAHGPCRVAAQRRLAPSAGGAATRHAAILGVPWVRFSPTAIVVLALRAS